MSRSLSVKALLFAALKRIGEGALIALIIYSTSYGNPFFSHPRDGVFKFVSGGQDPWYYLNPTQLAFQTPDKWQHYMGNFLFASPSEKLIGKWPTIILFASLNVLKEVEDGYREGASVRDLGVGIAGMLSSISGRKMLCTFDEDKILFKYFISVN
jgi:hypothetical protein